MTRDTFFRILSVALCAVILIGIVFGQLRLIHESKVRDFLLDYYSADQLVQRDNTYYAVLEHV